MLENVWKKTNNKPLSDLTQILRFTELIFNNRVYIYFKIVVLYVTFFILIYLKGMLVFHNFSK